MADKRMFLLNLITGDDFLDMTVGAQALYFHLCMRADDEGFLNNSQSIRKACQASAEDFNVLAAKGLIIKFDSGIVCIRHWLLHNNIRSDRFHETIYPERKLVHVVNGVYELGAEEAPKNADAATPQPTRNQTAALPQPTRRTSATNPQPLDEVTAAESSIEKDSIGEDRVDKNREVQVRVDQCRIDSFNDNIERNIEAPGKLSTLDDWSPPPSSYNKTIPIRREGYL